MAEKVTFAGVIKNRGFRLLWLNQVLVQLAYNTLNFALIVWVFKLADNNLAVSALILAMYLPVVFFGIFAGVFVDLHDRRKIIILVDILLAVLFFVFIFIKRSYPLILINTFLINSLVQFFAPSEGSSIPLLVSKTKLFLANSLFSLTLYGSLLVGYSVAGPILNIFGINQVFIFGSIMLILAFLIAHRLPSIKQKSLSSKSTSGSSLFDISGMIKLTFREAGKTFRFIKGKLSVTAAIGLMAGVQGAIGVLAAVMPSYLEKVLHIHATDASYFVMLPLGVGMVLGASLIGRLFDGRPRRTLVTPAIVFSGLLLMMMGLLPTLAQIFQSAELPNYITRPRYFFRAPSLSSLFGVIAFIMGFCMVAIVIPCQTVIQENTNEQNRGKIFSVLYVLMTAFAAIPVLAAGILSDVFGTIPILIGLGMTVLLTGVIVMRPHVFFEARHLPFRFREFLGLGHWETN